MSQDQEAVEYTPVTPRRGGLVHAFLLSSPNRTACNRTFKGWVIALDALTCVKCKKALFYPVL